MTWRSGGMWHQKDLLKDSQKVICITSTEDSKNIEAIQLLMTGRARDIPKIICYKNRRNFYCNKTSPLNNTNTQRRQRIVSVTTFTLTHADGKVGVEQ
jgi:hypothetical protein